MNDRRLRPTVRLLVMATALAAALPTAAAVQRITLRADDGISLGATWYEPSHRPAPAVVFVHMLHRSRQEWDRAAARLASDGFGALAFDLRGHGESGGRAAGDGDAGYVPMLLDLKAARRFVSGRPEFNGRVGIAGASLGANLAALEAAADPSIASVVLLSPSTDYRGLRIEAALRKVTSPVLLVASDDDPYAMRSARELQKAGGGPREVLVLRGAGHGTAMLSRDPDLLPALVDWFRRTLL